MQTMFRFGTFRVTEGGVYKDGPENFFRITGRARKVWAALIGRATHISGPSLYIPPSVNIFSLKSFTDNFLQKSRLRSILSIFIVYIKFVSNLWVWYFRKQILYQFIGLRKGVSLFINIV